MFSSIPQPSQVRFRTEGVDAPTTTHNFSSKLKTLPKTPRPMVSSTMLPKVPPNADRDGSTVMGHAAVDESPSSLLGIGDQVVKSEDEQGESGESTSNRKLFTEDDLGILATKHDMIRGKIQRNVQQKKDSRTKIKKPRRDRAGVSDYRPSAFAVVQGEKDHTKEQPRAFDRVLQEKVQVRIIIIDYSLFVSLYI